MSISRSNLPQPRRLFTRRRSRLTMALLAVAAIVVTACTPEKAPPRPDYSDIKVDWVTVTHNVAFAGNAADVAAAELSAIEAFLDKVDVRLTDQIALDPGAGTGPKLAAARADAITRKLRHRLPGLRVRLLENGAGGAQLVVGRYVAKAPDCPGWFSPEQRYAAFANPDNRVDANFGCATATNFAATLADPGDLVRGRNLGPADASFQALAVENYRKGESPHPYSTEFNKNNVREIE